MPECLIVEDDIDQADFYATALARLGFGVLRACNVDEALKVVKASRPDLVVLDIVLPLRSGYEFLDALRQGHPPVIAITGSSDVDVPLCYEKGAVVVLRKPFDLAELTAAAKRHASSLGTTMSFPKLTSREQQVLELIGSGSSSDDVAQILGISKNTVLVYRKAIKRKFMGQNFIQICAAHNRQRSAAVLRR